jgi:hypothetical protein
MVAAWLFGCTDQPSTSQPTQAQASATTTSSVAAPRAGALVLPPKRPFDPNPLQLPAMGAAKLEKGQGIWVVPRRMLEGARLGSSMKLVRARVAGVEGNDIMVADRYGASYPVHRGYAIIPHQGRLRRGDRVFAPYRGELRHGVVATLRRKQALIRFTDLGYKLRDQKVEPARVGRLGPGLEPGGYAVHRQADEWRHVLLVSKAKHRGVERWLVLGRAGAAQLVDAERLQPMPLRIKPKPKTGTALWVAWRGTMVPAAVRGIESADLFTLARARSGAPLVLGFGMVMPPP